MSSPKTFCTVISCMDGRIQLPVNAYLQRHFGTPFVDTVTEAGPVGLLAHHPDSPLVESIFKRVEISLQAHASQGLAVAAHYDCAGNPVPDEVQRQQLLAVQAHLAQRYPEVEVIALWVGADWQVHPIHQKHPS